MEANLNQFRLLTVEGETSANIKRKNSFETAYPFRAKSSSSANADLTKRYQNEECPSRPKVVDHSPYFQPICQPSDPACHEHHHRHHRHHRPSILHHHHHHHTPYLPSDLPLSLYEPSNVSNLRRRRSYLVSTRSLDDADQHRSKDKNQTELLDALNDVTKENMPYKPENLTSAIVSLERTIAYHNSLLSSKVFKQKKSCQNKSLTPSMGSETTEFQAVSQDNFAQSPTLYPSIAPKSSTKQDKMTVFMRVIFLKIGEIDTMKENFVADAFIQARWREPELDGMQDQNPSDIDFEKFWNPKLYVENNLGEPKETVWQAVSFDWKGQATLFERRRIKGCFLENLELDDFPFDTQDLTLTITSERADTELELEEDQLEISSINVQSFVDEQEWALHSHVETWKCITTKIFQNSNLKHPSFSTSCRASRRAGFYIWNIFLVMLFICSLTFATFSVELTKPENRLQLSFILLLTTITFKFVVSQTLPRISYLTYLDKYILISMAILCSVCVWHAIIPMFKYDLHLARVIDRWGLGVSACSYFLFHVVFFMYIYIMALKKRWKYNQKDKEHKERVKKLQQSLEQQLIQQQEEMMMQHNEQYEQPMKEEKEEDDEDENKELQGSSSNQANNKPKDFSKAYGAFANKTYSNIKDKDSRNTEYSIRYQNERPSQDFSANMESLSNNKNNKPPNNPVFKPNNRQVACTKGQLTPNNNTNTFNEPKPKESIQKPSEIKKKKGAKKMTEIKNHEKNAFENNAYKEDTTQENNGAKKTSKTEDTKKIKLDKTKHQHIEKSASPSQVLHVYCKSTTIDIPPDFSDTQGQTHDLSSTLPSKLSNSFDDPSSFLSSLPHPSPIHPSPIHPSKSPSASSGLLIGARFMDEKRQKSDKTYKELEIYDNVKNDDIYDNVDKFQQIHDTEFSDDSNDKFKKNNDNNKYNTNNKNNDTNTDIEKNDLTKTDINKYKKNNKNKNTDDIKSINTKKNT